MIKVSLRILYCGDVFHIFQKLFGEIPDILRQCPGNSELFFDGGGIFAETSDDGFHEGVTHDNRIYLFSEYRCQPASRVSLTTVRQSP